MRRPHQGCAILALLIAAAIMPIGSSGWAQVSQTKSESVGTPSYYPADYQKIIDAAKGEGGKLVIYSSYTQKIWSPVFKAFQEQYPFIKDVRSLDLEGEEVYQRLLAETSRGIAGADIVEVQPSVGAQLRQRASLLLEYHSPESSKYPKDILQPFPRGYQYAIAAAIIGYNTKVLRGSVISIEDIAKQLKEPGGSKLTIGVRDIKSQFAFTTYYTLLNANPKLWDAFETILKYAKPEGSSGSLVTKLQIGEYAAAVFVIDAAMLPAAKQSGGLLQAVLPKDGVPFQGTAVAIPASTSRPNTAKLFIDFILSEKGQQAVLDGGRPAIRAGLKPVEGLYSFEQATNAIPKESMAIVPYEQIPQDKADEFAKRWNQLRSAAR